MYTLILKFQKIDKFNNPVFIAAKSDIPESYEKLRKYHKILESKNFGTFLPLYSHFEHSYSTVRFFKNVKFNNFTEGAKYEVKFNITTKEKNEKTYVNCHIKKIKFISKPVEIDEGVEIELE